MPTDLEIGDYVAIDLDENNAHLYPDQRTEFGWGVCRHGHGLQAFGDGYMTERVARARADVLNAGRPATEVPNV